MIKYCDNKVYIELPRQNNKLKPSNNVGWLIWNLPEIKTCPYATPHCIEKCYARKASKQYKDVVTNARQQNYILSLRKDFPEIMIDYIEKVATGSRKKVLIVRIHESGDFYSQEYFNKWNTITKYFNKKVFKGTKVILQAYTKSIPFVKGCEDLATNFNLISSIWEDTEPDMIKLTEELQLATYKAVKSFKESNIPVKCQCHCIDCATCLKCYSTQYIQWNIAVEIH